MASLQNSHLTSTRPPAQQLKGAGEGDWRGCLLNKSVAADELLTGLKGAGEGDWRGLLRRLKSTAVERGRGGRLERPFKAP